MTTTHCYICNASVPYIDGPVCNQKYIPQSPGCWKLYSEVLGREYGEWKYPDIHRLTVDCYAAQHPTLESNDKSAQSISVHLVGIHLYIHKNMPAKDITKFIGRLVEKHKGNFVWLRPPINLGEITIADVHRAKDLDEHTTFVSKWARCIWDSWHDHQGTILKLANNVIIDS